MKQLLITLALLGGGALAQTTTPPSTTPATPAPAQTAPAQTSAAQDSAVVGRIGQEVITLAEFNRAFRQAVARVLNSQGVPFEESYMAEFNDARGEFLKQYLRDRAVYQLARGSVKADAAEIDKQVADARADFESDAEFADALSGTGYASEADLRADLERQLIVGTYLRSIQSRFKFGDAVVAGNYNLNRTSFMRQREACARHILVKSQAEAQAVVKELQAGGDFAKIATSKSQDPGSAAQGGDLGCFGEGDMVATFDKASFTGPLNTPQIVQSEFGWHVVLVSKRTEAGMVPLAEAAPVIREQLTREAAQKYLNSQIAKMKTESFPDVVKVTAAPAPK
ncbi:peptidylprolyl isomerase [Deinococcus deserti]|uniref:Putative PpiC-type peptidyl-prolyl cis-trans isomerase n=1 Tax=Deinococcus deserti (strain DSM 17065 / CIP 109153 / LMG 22923 / VCD115) TaxID=546414 RepID=C1CUT5_DEIDV|nr:peptidylprolyl isomerase [Deinococcus deserti]ACO45952.1 putative PpiC-type peptidyl-prolyl cis-trans isomerase precursor [Deinococcus deserti VCD115]